MSKPAKPYRILIICVCAVAAVLALTAVVFIIMDNIVWDEIELRKIVYRHRWQNPDRYTVYIQENGVYEPYLAIDGDYGGNVLLLRKYLTDEKVPQRDGTSPPARGGYYPLSKVDEYLRIDYISKFSPMVQSSIIDTSVIVANRETVNHSGAISEIATEIIQRKIFLLSATELTIRARVATVEGSHLKYYKDNKDKTKTYKDGRADAYWLRSAYHWNAQSWVIWANGKTGGGGVAQDLALQPAFCLPRGTLLQKDEVNGKAVYVFNPEQADS